MAYRSIESAIRGIVSEDNLAEAALGDYKGLLALAMRKSGDEQSAMKAAAEMMKKGQMKDLNIQFPFPFPFPFHLALPSWLEQLAK